MRVLTLIALLASFGAPLRAAAPPAPTGLTATATGASGAVALSWNAVSTPVAVTGYHVYYNSVSDLAGSTEAYVTATSATVTGLPDRVTRWFFVASDEAGVGAGLTGTPVSAASFQAPDAPTLSAQPLSYSSRVRLSWNQPAAYGSSLGAIRLETVSGSTVTSIGTYAPGVVSVTVTVGCGNPVSFQARAYDAFGSSSAASSIAAVALLCPTVATAGSLNSGSLHLTWLPGAGAPSLSGWEIRSASQAGTADPLGNFVSTVLSSTTSVDIPAPAQGAGLWAKVYAIDGSGIRSAGSNEVGLLRPPDDLSATPSSGRVLLQWSAASANAAQAVAQYQVYYATYPPAGYNDAFKSVSLSPAVAGSAQSVTVAGLTDQVRYWFTVAAAGGSATVQVGPPSLTVSAIPSLPSPVFSAATALSSSTLSFTWSAVDVGSNSPAAYHLNRSFNPNLSSPVLLTRTSLLSISTVAQAGPGTVAWYFVTVTDTAGSASALSPSGGALLRLPSLAAPVLALAETGNARVRLQWQPVAEASYYQVYRSTTGAFSALLGGQTNGTSFTDVDPVNGGANYYHVNAFVPIGLGGAVHASESSNNVTAVPRVLPGIPGAYALSANGTSLAYLTAVASASSGADLVWAPASIGSSAISGYNVYRGYSAQALTLVASPVGATLTAFHDAAAPLPALGLVYGVEAFDQNGATGARITGTVGSRVDWPAPASLARTVLTGGVRLSWASPAGMGSYALSAYSVSRRWVSGGPYDSLANVTSLAYTDLNPDASQGSQPSYQVRVLDRGGNLGASVTVTATLASAGLNGGLPAQVSGVSAVNLANALNQVALSWRPAPESDGVLSYAVYRGGAFIGSTGTASYVDAPGLGSNSSYQVQAINAQGGGLSGTASPSPIFCAPPQPQWVSAVASVDPAREGGALGLRLAWEDLGAPSAVDGYDVFGATGAYAGVVTYTALASNLTGTAYEDFAAVPGSLRSYSVAAVSGAYFTASPTTKLQVQVPAAPQTVSGLSASARSDGAWLGWDPQGAASEYWVFRATYALAAHPLVSERIARSTVNAYADGSADASMMQHYRVAAVNGLGRAAAANVDVSPLGGQPSYLSATAGYAAGAQVRLDWGAPSGSQSATGYVVWRASDAGILNAGGGTQVANTAALTYTDASLNTNTAYYYGVNGVGFASGPRSVTGPVLAYLPASQPQARAVGTDGGVDLSWSPAPAYQGVTGWALSLSVGGVTSTVQLGAATTGHNVSGLAPNTLVGVTVTALNSAGASSSGAYVSAVANAVGPAPQPLSFSALSSYPGGSSTGAQVRLSWSAPGAGTVLLYRSAAPMAISLAAGGTSSPLYLTGVSGIFSLLTDTVQAPGLSYDYAITALSAAGLPGGESVPRLASTVLAARAAGLVGLTGTAGSGRVDLRWSQPADNGSAGLAAKPFRLHRRSGGSAPALDSIVDDAGFPVDLSGNAMVDLKVVNGTSYWYLLSTVDAAGIESRQASAPLGSDGKPTSLQPQGPPSAPSSVLAIPSDRTVTLRWVATQAIAASGAKYNVYRRLASGDYGAPIPELFQVGPNSSDFVNGLQGVVLTLRDSVGSASPPVNKTAYLYSISSVNTWGEGPKSAEIAATPFKALDPGMTVAANRALSLSVSGKKDVALSWGATPDQLPADGYNLASYRVYRSQNGGNSYDLLADITLTAMVDSSTAYGGAYTYRVVPVDSAGNEGYSYTLKTVVIPAAVNSVLVFRNAFNPAIGEQLPLQFALQQSGHAWVKIFTLNGEYVATVFDEEVPNASVEQPFLSERKLWDGRNADGQVVASGVYLIHLEAPGFRQNARVAVIK